jgi:hypothetical protein
VCMAVESRGANHKNEKGATNLSWGWKGGQHQVLEKNILRT